MNNSSISVRNDFSKVANTYAKYRRDYPNQVYDLIHRFCPDKDFKVLDVGCGTGLVTNHLAQYHKEVVGSDKEQGMIDRIKKEKNTSFVVAPAEELPFKDNTFDLVTVAQAYHWFNYDLAGKEMYRILKPDGKLCVFWKYDRGESKNYLPNFASNNLKKYITKVPKSNKEPIAKEIFHRVGFDYVVEKEFDFDDVYSKEEILGYVQSHSTFNLLDDDQKVQYVKDNAESVEKYLVDRNFILKSRIKMYFIKK